MPARHNWHRQLRSGGLILTAMSLPVSAYLAGKRHRNDGLALLPAPGSRARSQGLPPGGPRLRGPRG